MLTSLALAAALAVAGQSYRYERYFEAEDARGQVWTHADRNTLADFVRSKNREYRAADLAKLVEGMAARTPVQPPAAPPAVRVPPSPDAPSGAGVESTPPEPLNFGVNRQKIPQVTRAWVGGNAGPRAAGAGAELGAGRLHLTAIAPTVAEAEKAVRGWESDPSFRALETALGDRLAVQAYAADNPLAAGVGLPDGGKPDVVLQGPDGKVLYRSHADPGAAVLVGEIRKRDPSYDPARDPSGDGPAAGSLAELLNGWSVFTAGAAAVCLVLLLRGPK